MIASSRTIPTRFIGLDIHKHYLVAVGVDAHQQPVFGPCRVNYPQLTTWITQHLTANDVVVLEMTTNTFQIHDELLPHVESVTVVHPQHVALVTQVPVKTDTKAAPALAQLLAAGLLKGIWVPACADRDLRTLVVQRQKLRRCPLGISPRRPDRPRAGSDARRAVDAARRGAQPRRVHA